MSDDVSKNIEQFINHGLDVKLNWAMNKACAVVANDAKKRCPKDTGNLRRSIDFQAEPTEGVIYANTEYAPYVEVGTGIYSSKGNGRKEPWTYKGRHGFFRTSGNPAQPFLEPAARANKSDILDCFKGLI